MSGKSTNDNIPYSGDFLFLHSLEYFDDVSNARTGKGYARLDEKLWNTYES
jgi:hypothetical protein